MTKGSVADGKETEEAFGRPLVVYSCNTLQVKDKLLRSLAERAWAHVADRVFYILPACVLDKVEGRVRKLKRGLVVGLYDSDPQGVRDGSVGVSALSITKTVVS